MILLAFTKTTTNDYKNNSIINIVMIAMAVMVILAMNYDNDDSDKINTYNDICDENNRKQ